MSGSLAVGAKIVWCRHQPPAKMMLPNAVHHYSCGERVGRGGEPGCQAGAASLGWKSHRLRGAKHTRKSWVHLFSGLVVIAALQNERFRRRSLGAGEGHRPG